MPRAPISSATAWRPAFPGPSLAPSGWIFDSDGGQASTPPTTPHHGAARGLRREGYSRPVYPFPPSPDATRASSTHHPALRSRSRRQLWLTIHLYLGLAAGLVFVIAGVTGTAIAFGEDLDAWLNADLMTVVAPTEGLRARRPVDELFEAARSTMPADASPMYLRLPREPERAVSLSYGTTSAAFPEDMDHFEVFVDPYTGQVIGQRVQNIAGAPFSGPLMGLLVELHYNLLIGPLGAVLVGIVAAFLMVSLVTGLI
ncbi:MAG: hypothetical protein FJ189_02765, partial [Gammaproteobacteria bacterium]|nr:hypothetical protein [Gammaproteobacteria bacterium]